MDQREEDREVPVRSSRKGGEEEEGKGDSTRGRDRGRLVRRDDLS